ncbi:MAG: FkbM family methyltransferase [Ignavibacteriae bacterium]|nr:FkbM family methyltransferase [Ignavibacteriota bacterium]
MTTRFKVFIAHLLFLVVRIFKGNETVIAERKGIWFSLDLSEGIDLSVYLFGGFQKHLFSPRIKLNDGDAILDVGANCGVISLNFAKRFPKAKVFSFEPTDYAFDKFLNNLSLNEDSIRNVVPVKAFVCDVNSESNDYDIYSSWKVDSIDKGAAHPVHLGIKKSARNIPSFTLDSFVAEHKVGRVGFIKIDTDGNEWGVLKGAAGTILRDRPTVVFEVGGYLLEEKGQSFEMFIKYFEEKKYKLYTADFKKVISSDNYKYVVPGKYTIDVFGVAE